VSTESITSYLNDHLAGSIVALELLDHLVETAPTAEARQFFTTLHHEITKDQQVLQDLLYRVGGTESRLRKAAAWLTEKLSEVKLRLNEATGGELHQLEALEALALGIHGKLSLWLALEAVSGQLVEVRELDLARLQQRARDQYAQVESRRIAAARLAFSGLG
jgi:hypothetical protein